ncbi:MAG TPA: T9SS type A sorting domain-containing protein [Flavobacterium sp.]|jgi:hypothetical protein
MKKILLSTGIIIGLVFTGNAQVLQAEDFNSLSIGNVGTDITGNTPGQANFLTYATNGSSPSTTTNASVTNFQVVLNGFEATSGLGIESQNGNQGERVMGKAGGITAAWAARTTGNNVIQAEYDFFTGPSSTSTTENGVRIQILTSTNVTMTIAGFGYNLSTKTIRGVAYINNQGTFSTPFIDLGTAETRVLSDNTWYKLGVAYDTSNGNITWKVNSGNNNLITTSLDPEKRTGPFQPNRVNFVSFTRITNTASASVIYDNFIVTATPTIDLLGNVKFSDSQFSVYPNPSNNVINIANDANMLLNAVTITDLNGRTVQSIKLNNVNTAQVNISDLSAGMYMMNIASDQGNVTKKIIKN